MGRMKQKYRLFYFLLIASITYIKRIDCNYFYQFLEIKTIEANFYQS